MRFLSKITLIILIHSLASCSSSTKLIDIPFSEPKYQSDVDFIRASGMGKNLDKRVAQTIAMNKAREAMGGQIKSIVEQQITELKRSNSDNTSFSQFEKTTKVIVDETLSNYDIMDQKTIKNKDGETEVHIVLQMARSVLMKNIKASMK